MAKVDGWEFTQSIQPNYVLLFGVDTVDSFLLCDCIYGDASGGSLPQGERCLPQSAGDGFRSKKDCTVATGVMG